MDLYWLSLYEFNRKSVIKWLAVNATQLSCIKVKHILKDYFLNYYFLGFYKYILQYSFEDFPLKMYTLSFSSQGASRRNLDIYEMDFVFTGALFFYRILSRPTQH